jgi:putative ABC transport system permease protein
MMLLIEVGLSVGLGAMLGAASLFGLQGRTLFLSLMVVLGPAVDAGLAAGVAHWLGLGPVVTVLFGGLAGLLSSLLLPAMLVPRRGLAARIAVRGIVARPRQAALLVLALVVSSSIVSSSLVVGDSLDATVTLQVEAVWSETDLVLEGRDPATAQPIPLTEAFWTEVATGLGELKQDDGSSLFDGARATWAMPVAVEGPNGRALPSVGWYAQRSLVEPDPWPPLRAGEDRLTYSDLNAISSSTGRNEVAITQPMANELDLVLGDQINITWSTIDDGFTVRRAFVGYVQAILQTEGGAAIGGLNQAAMFTSFEAALLEGGGHATSLHLSATLPFETTSAAAAATDALQPLTDRAWTATMEGLTTEVVQNGVSITRSTGLGRLESHLVQALHENVSGLLSDPVVVEAVQAPLQVFEVNDINILGLADAHLVDLVWDDRYLWHVGMSGAGVMVEATGRAQVWTVPKGGVLEDHLVAHNAGWFASEAGLHRLDATRLDDGMRLLDASPTLAVEVLGDEVLALVDENGSVDVRRYDPSGALASISPLNLSIPSPLLSVHLAVDEDILLLELEGLFGEEVWELDVGPLDVNARQTNASMPERGAPQPRDMVAANASFCDGRTGVVDPMHAGLAWCGGEDGLFGWDLSTGQVKHVRISVEADVEGLGRVPRMVLGLSGDGIPDRPFRSLEPGPALSALNMGEGDEAWVAGRVPWAWGDATLYRLNATSSNGSVLEELGLANLSGLLLGIVSAEDAAMLAGAEVGDRHLLVLTSNGSTGVEVETAVRAWLDEAATLDSGGVEVAPVRLEAGLQAEESAGLFAGMFLVFGGFTIAAGTLLAITVVVLLVEARRRDLATLRSVGMTRSDIRAIALLEGLLLASLAGVLGGASGVLLGRIVAYGFSSAFTSVGAEAFAFGWSWSSVAAGAVWGTCIAVCTLAMVAQWSSRLDVLHALRGVRTRVRRDLPWQVLVVVVLSIGASALAGLSLALVGPDAAGARMRWVIIGDGLLIAATLVLVWILPVARRGVDPAAHRRRARAPGRAIGAAALAVLLWTSWPDSLDPVRGGMAFDELSLLVLGLVQVIASVLVLVTVAPAALRALQSRQRRPRLIARLAIAHPMAQPARTAVVMSMFAVTVFAVVVLAGYTSQFTAASSEFVHESEGEFEVLLTGSRTAPLLIGDDPSAWGLDPIQASRIDAVASVSRAVVLLDAGQDTPVPYILRGAGASFAEHGGLSLYLWDDEFGATEAEVWSTVLSRDDLVIVDASFGLETATDGAAVGLLPLSLGERVELVQPGDPANRHTVRVAGYLAQSSLAFSPGVWANASLVDDRFDGAVTRVYVSVAENVEVYSSDPLEVEVPPGKSEAERRAAAGVAEAIDAALAQDAVHVTLLVDEVLVLRALVIAILDIFRAYLALGLGVGLMGIGVVTARAVQDRTGIIGLLRAVGMPRRSVGLSLLGEVAWTGGLGLLVGSGVGLLFHVQLHAALWAEQGAALVLPWSTALGIVLCGAFLIGLAVAVPVRRATNIPPAAALRSNE